MEQRLTRDRFAELMTAREALPEGVKSEIVAGEIRVLPRPAPVHVRVGSRLGGLLDTRFGLGDGGPGGWVILDEPDVLFGDEVRSPDLAGWRSERYDEPSSGPYLVVPDWISEILSPSTAGTDRSEKLPLYARHGVGHLWLIDPIASTLEVLRRQGELWLVVAVHAGDTSVRAEPFDAVDLDLALVWRKR